MIDESLQDKAVQYLLGELSHSDAARFERFIENDTEAASFVKDIREALGDLALTAPSAAPPPELFEAVLQKVQPPERKIVRFPWVPWAVAASFAVVCTVLAADRTRMTRELAEFRHRDTMAQLQIARLSSQADAYQKALAIVVWNAEEQRGVLDLSNLPSPGGGRDYQLWVIDPSYAQPVSAGVVTLGANGETKVGFRADQAIHAVKAFAISVEAKGGSPTPKGQIVLAGA